MNDSTFLTAFVISSVAILFVYFISFLAKQDKERQRLQQEEAQRRKEEIERLWVDVPKVSPFMDDVRAFTKENPVHLGIKERYEKKFRLPSKQAFDSFNVEKRVIETITKDYDWFKEIYKFAKDNEENEAGFKALLRNYEDYDIPDDILSAISTTEDDYRQVERDIISVMERQDYNCMPLFIFEWEYRTPKQGNRYTAAKVYDINDIGDFIERVDRIAEYRESKEYQRARITPSVRMNVIKADQSRCCLCGKMAADGATLEVDHFIPVSKGGKSDIDNLWTLCWDCNRGKSDMATDELQEAFDRAIANRG